MQKDCFSAVPLAVQRTGAVKYEISGNKLVDFPTIHALQREPIRGLSWFQIIETDDAEIVAGSPRSVMGHPPNNGSRETVTVGAEITVINKSNGNYASAKSRRMARMKFKAGIAK